LRYAYIVKERGIHHDYPAGSGAAGERGLSLKLLLFSYYHPSKKKIISGAQKKKDGIIIAME